MLPDVLINIKDGGLGIQPSVGTGVHCKIGVSSLGVSNQMISLTDPDQIAEKLGTGPLANAVADSFMDGLGVVYAIPAAGDVAGSVGAVTAVKTGTGNMTAAATAAGSVLDEFDAIIKIVDAGRLNVATFQYSLDGGDTYSGKITVPAGGTYAVPQTGVTLTFTEAGAQPEESFKAGDTYKFKTVAPTASVNSVNDAIDVALDTNLIYEGIHVVGASSSSLWAALAVRVAEAESRFRYIYALVEAAGPSAGQTVDAWVTALLAEAASFADTRVAICAGRLELIDQLTGRQMERNGAGVFMGRVKNLHVQESAGKVIVGPLPGVVGLRPAGINNGHIHALDEAGFITFRQYEGLNGFYITNFRIKAEPISDFQYGELRRVMDKACRLVRIAALRFEHAEATPEGIDALKAHLQQPLNIMRGDSEITNGRIVIPPNQDILATSRIKVKIRIVPVGIMRWIDLDIGFENPFLTGGSTT